MVAALVSLSVVAGIAPAAQAFQPPRPVPPVAYPGSVLTAVNTSAGEAFDVDEWNRRLKEDPKALPTGKSSTWGKVGAVAVAGGGLSLGLDIGTGLAGVVGLSTTGSFACDLSALFSGTTSCRPAPAPEYTVNGDIEVTPAGWVDGLYTYLGNLVQFPGGAVVGTRTVTVSAASPPIGTAGTLEVVYEVTPPFAPATHITYHQTVVADSGTCNTGGGGGSGALSSGGQYVNTRSVSGGTCVWHLQLGPADNTNGGSLTWYPEGHVSRPPEADANPQRWWRTTWECSVGTGGTLLSSAFREADPEWPGFPAAECDAGAVTYLLIEQITAGGPTTTITEWTAPEEYTGFADEWPHCVGGGCQLLLWRLSDPEVGHRLSCHINPELCLDWFKDPAKEDNYVCTYAGVDVALAECNVYAPNFDPDAGEDTQYGDPTTGEGAEGDEDLGEQVDDCPPPFEWWSLFNPWWYYKSGVCVLEWAFVPTQTTAQIQMIRDAWDQTTPAVWAGAFGDVVDGLAIEEAGCMGPELNWEFIGVTIYPFNACEEPLATVASYAKAFATVLVVVFGGLACIRALGSGIGWSPGIRSSS